MNTEANDTMLGWHLKLFNVSVLKQRKLKEIASRLGSTNSKKCLDLGSDNGVISYYLRRDSEGEWSSSDLTVESVNSITSLVGERVVICQGDSLPYPDSYFDLIAVVDMLEHVKDDAVFARELDRVMKAGGRLIINAPNLKRFSPLRGFRHLIGQTDEAHGHLRPGYGLPELKRVFDFNFDIKSSDTYSRFFSEMIDTAIVSAYSLLTCLNRKKSTADEATSVSEQDENSEEISKGLVFTEDDMKRFEKSFKLYSKIYPIVRAFSSLDLLIPFIPGFMRITVLEKRK
jgi:ubiquinone/menaquinone biosynthesis C-methylase UbiE